jgi:hypothetical protein
MLVKRGRREEGRRTEGKNKAEWGKRGQGANTKEKQSAMEGKYRGRAQRGEGRKDDDGQYYEGRCEPGGGEGRTVLARMKRQDYLWIRKRSEEG